MSTRATPRIEVHRERMSLMELAAHVGFRGTHEAPWSVVVAYPDGTDITLIRLDDHDQAMGLAAMLQQAWDRTMSESVSVPVMNAARVALSDVDAVQAPNGLVWQLQAGQWHAPFHFPQDNPPWDSTWARDRRSQTWHPVFHPEKGSR